MTPNQTPILGFFGAYRFLSNFWTCPVPFEGITYPSLETAYQAAKTVLAQERARMATLTPAQAKFHGRRLTLRPHWDLIKIPVMCELVLAKFENNPELTRFLTETGSRHLEETNSWGDRFWGVCNGTGRNELGRILMSVRRILQNTPPQP